MFQVSLQRAGLHRSPQEATMAQPQLNDFTVSHVQTAPGRNYSRIDTNDGEKRWPEITRAAK